MIMPSYPNYGTKSLCVGCECTEGRQCWDHGKLCHWLRVDRDLGKGVCSCCADCVPDWDAGKYDKRTRIGPIDV